MTRSVRPEPEIFADLEKLCASPGYVHAIAFLCFRDNYVGFADQMTADDLRHMFSPTRLIRTEISTLIGLMIKHHIDFTLQRPDVVQKYIEETETLLEELHRAMSHGIFEGIDFTKALPKDFDPFSRGEALREPIFYSGESAYSFQYRDLAVRKYAADNEWLEANKGFSIQAARDVVHAVGKLQDEKLATAAHGLQDISPDKWTLIAGFSFTAQELSESTRISQDVVEKVLTAFTLPEGNQNQGFHAVHDFNVANATPLLRAPDGSFMLLAQYSLVEALYDAPFYWMGSDAAYVNTAMKHRGQFTEEFSRERLELVFGKERVYSNVHIHESKAKKAGEIDVLVIFGNRAIVVQAKSKRLTLEARKGNDLRIQDDFKKSVQDAYDQGLECAKLINVQNLKFVDAGSREIRISEAIKEVYIFCVVADHYPALSFQTRQFLKYKRTEVIQAPFVMDVFTLDAMTEMLQAPLRLLSYVNRRTGYADKVMAAHELTILSQHLKRNLWVEKQYDMVWLEDDISVDLDIAMTARRDNIPGKRTPEGIWTRIANTTLGKVVTEIESRPEAATLELGFMLLTLSEKSFVDVSKAMDEMARRARQDGKNHDITVGFSAGAMGLTVHCNDDPMAEAGPRLQAHCEGRKYTQKAAKWFGVCLRPSDKTLRFGVNLDFKWESSAEMDAMVRSLPNVQSPGVLESLTAKRKTGRNDPCPCGSGRKYKKCCLR